ncbi:spore coat protein [Clostridium rectalis]|uniref:spore coat protein n=1 Tax=Clostridium rectalis TaxID=2040295 RepID=UPI000F62D9D0|nr:spore coat protein [Clostridium rectalis]
MIYKNTFKDYILAKGIQVVDKFSSYDTNKTVNEHLLEEQLLLISSFHKIVKGDTGPIKDRLDSSIGRVVENYKVGTKKLARDMKRLKSDNKYGQDLNEFEKIILSMGNYYIERGEKVIKHVYDNKYYDLITRSMQNREICLGSVDFKNIVLLDNIMVKRIDKCSYNMVEMDCFNLLYKYKKKGYKFDYKKLVSKFCEFEKLNKNSYEYIIALLSYPYEVIRQCNRYRQEKKGWTEEEYVLRLKKAMEVDKESLI